MAVLKEQATVYRSTLSGRRYFTRRAAIQREASTMIEKKYPTEREEVDEHGRRTNSGWHWTLEPRLVRLHHRVCRLLTSHPTQESQDG